MVVAMQMLFEIFTHRVWGIVREGALVDYDLQRGPSHGEEGELIFGCLPLLQGKQRRQVMAIELREVESFLRTDNHLALAVGDYRCLERLWPVLQQSLLRSLLVVDGGWERSSLLQRVRTVEQILEQKIRPALAPLQVELLDIVGSGQLWEVRLACEERNRKRVEFIQHVLAEELRCPGIRVLI